MTEAERYAGQTPFQEIYNKFFSTVTEEMYLEWDEDETKADIKNILISAIPGFSFPRFKLYDYEKTTDSGTNEITVGDTYNFLLDEEEIDIFSGLMVGNWINRQILTADVTRQKYSSRDFEFTSQANHLGKLMSLKELFAKTNNKKQKMYKRRKTDADGYIRPNFGMLGGKKNAY